jgi:hypothetical protein
MKVKFLKKYASRMAEIFALRAVNARKRGEKEDYVKELEGRANLWGKISELPTNCEKWADVSDYITLMSTPQTTKMELRRQYKFLQEIIASDASPNFQRNFDATSTQPQHWEESIALKSKA